MLFFKTQDKELKEWHKNRKKLMKKNHKRTKELRKKFGYSNDKIFQTPINY